MTPAHLFCSICFQMGNRCPRADDDTKKCTYIIDDALALRLANGTYDAQLTAASASLAGLTPAHLDNLLGYTKPGGSMGVLTAAEQVVYDSAGNDPAFDGLTHNNLQAGLSLARKRPSLYEAIRERMETLLATVAATNVQRVEAFLRMLTTAMDKGGEAVTTTTASAYKELTFPISQLWISVSKKALHGQELGEEVDAKTMFDPTIGKTLVPFEKVQTFRTPAHLLRAFAMFKEAVTVLFGLAPSAWTGFETQVYRTEAACGFALTQRYVGEVLRRLDHKDYPNIGALMAAGEHNRILDDLRPPLVPLVVPGGNESDAGSGKRVNLANITVQGEFASHINHQYD